MHCHQFKFDGRVHVIMHVNIWCEGSLCLIYLLGSFVLNRHWYKRNCYSCELSLFQYLWTEYRELLILDILRKCIRGRNIHHHFSMVSWKFHLELVKLLRSLGGNNIMLFRLWYPTWAVLLLKSVDYGRMAEILVQRAAATDEFTKLTAITWVGTLMHVNSSIQFLLCFISLKSISTLYSSADKWVCKAWWRSACSSLR